MGLFNQEQFEDEIYQHQEKVIREEYGEREERAANYGWGVSERDWGIEIETKVYGPRKVLKTTRAFPDGAFVNEWIDL